MSEIDWAKLIKDYQAIFAALLTVSIVAYGWIKNHKLTLKAQDKHLLNQIANTARIEITYQLTDYQIYLSELNKYLDALPSRIKINGDSKINWVEEQRLFTNILSKHAVRWILLFHQYHSIFPELTLIIDKLDERNKTIYQWALWFDKAFFVQSHDENSRMLILNEAIKQNGRVSDQVCLIEDLLIYLQNKILSRLTENNVPFPDYRDNVYRPKIRVDEKGNPQFNEGSNNYPSNIQFDTAIVGPDNLLNIEGRQRYGN